ncbi:MAG TPA: hypothetical protein VH062_23440 [Polyangiaceae bacterium]|jgi:hypothetical protein|nr:hypothetical protein [Polyangiaceae bacterium]
MLSVRIRLLGATVALGFSVACSGGDSTNVHTGVDASASGGAPNGGISAGTGGKASAGGQSGGSAGAMRGAGGNGVAGTSGGGAGGRAGVDAGGVGRTADSGDDSGAGGAAKVPLPYCGGLSADLSTDTYNCGMCGKACQPQSLAYGLDAPGSVATDAKFVYWAEHIASGRIFQLSLGSANTANPPAIASGQKNPRSLAVDATNVYWLTDNGVMKRPVAGGAAVSLATEAGGRGPSDLAIDGTSVYWTTHSDASPNYAAVKKMPLGGGTAVEVATMPVVDFDSIAVDATNVYWGYTDYHSITTQDRDDIIYEAPLGGGTPVEVYRVSGYTSILDLATNGGYLYFTTFYKLSNTQPFAFTTGSLMRLPLTGGKAVTVGTGQMLPVGFGLNAEGAFWATTDATGLMTGPPGGGIGFAPTGVGTPFALDWSPQPTSLAVTATSLYISSWLDNGTNQGTVTRIGLCANSVCQ